MNYLNHYNLFFLMIKNFKPRLYQQTIFATCAEKNTLVVLPTGLGKTFIFIMLAGHQLKKYPEKKIMFLGPTRPLISQYHRTFKNHLEMDDSDMVVFTGHVPPEKREKLAKHAKIIFSTPQGMENDIINNRIQLNEFSLLGFDEAHRATGDYSYVWIAEQYMKKAKNPKIIALTASPGSKQEKIKEVAKNLFIEEIEVRTDSDPDVKPYIHESKVNWIYVKLTKEFKDIKKYLEDCFKSKLKKINELGLLETDADNYSKKKLLGMQAELQGRISRGERNFEIMKSISVLAEAMKVHHAQELLETQSISSLSKYMEGMVAKARSTRVKAVKNLVRDLHFRAALVKTRNLVELKIEHPKITELNQIIKKEIKLNPKDKIIVFSQYRDSVSKIVDELNKIEKIKAKVFVGQAKKRGTGLTQKKQIELIKDFSEGKFNVICMTSVGEEGLDIPSVNTVIFYEPIPSAIRTIQRKGRTGRHKKGKIYVLVAKNTRDEAYRWAAFHKEKRMHRILGKLKKNFEMSKNKKLTDFTKKREDIIIYSDYREKGSGIIKKLIDMGVNIKLEKIDIGDYLLSSRVIIEHKTVPDFVDSIVDKRLMTQVKDMKKYDSPVIIIEGQENLYTQRKIHPNVIQSTIASIIVDYKIPVLYTKDDVETAQILKNMARREQEERETSFTLHSNKPLTKKEQQEYIVSSFPGVGPGLSEPLLERFKTIKNIVNAKEKDLQQVNQIGKKKAKIIKDIVEEEYKK
ncbi:DEAD/DEAH box helicase [Candidatus Woesearchaeota archaeon]|nr:DEAD/DEAH box helicase [Candidatus Woesearchaeota archaeon]